MTTAENNNDTDETDTEKNASPILADDHDEIDKKQFERHKFPRDSGCFASSSSPASDRSSQPSQSESGIQPDDDIDDCYSDENNVSQNSNNPAQKGPVRGMFVSLALPAAADCCLC